MRDLADGLKLEHEIKGRNLENPNIGHAQKISHRLNCRARQPAFLLLGAPQQRDHGAGLPTLGKFGHLRLCPSLIGRCESKGAGLICV
jgi:hypothetical protein